MGGERYGGMGQARLRDSEPDLQSARDADTESSIGTAESTTSDDSDGYSVASRNQEPDYSREQRHELEDETRERELFESGGSRTYHGGMNQGFMKYVQISLLLKGSRQTHVLFSRTECYTLSQEKTPIELLVQKILSLTSRKRCHPTDEALNSRTFNSPVLPLRPLLHLASRLSTKLFLPRHNSDFWRKKKPTDLNKVKTTVPTLNLRRVNSSHLDLLATLPHRNRRISPTLANLDLQLFPVTCRNRLFSLSTDRSQLEEERNLENLEKFKERMECTLRRLPTEN